MGELTAEQYNVNFQNELKELLQKYKVEIVLEDIGFEYYIMIAEFDYHSEIGSIEDISFGRVISHE